MKILIVEDNAGVRRLVHRAVAGIADGILECEDGAEALTAYQSYQPDVVLMDVHMPRVDGLTATKQIRHFDPAARVVMVTDLDDQDFCYAAQEAGSCGYVLKTNLLHLPSVVLSLFPS